MFWTRIKQNFTEATISNKKKRNQISLTLLFKASLSWRRSYN